MSESGKKTKKLSKEWVSLGRRQNIVGAIWEIRFRRNMKEWEKETNLKKKRTVINNSRQNADDHIHTVQDKKSVTKVITINFVSLTPLEAMLRKYYF